MEKLPEKEFNEIFSLISNVPWLQSKATSLVFLYNNCENEEQRKLVIDLLRRFRVVDSREIDRIGEMIADKLCKEWNLNAGNSYIISVSDETKIDGGQGLLQQIKNKFAKYEWSNENFISTIGQGVHLVKDGEVAVLFDDFIGSGETIMRKYHWFKNKLTILNKPNVIVKVLSIAAMEQTYFELITRNVVLYSSILILRGISDFYQTDTNHYLQCMLDIEKGLEEKNKKMSLTSYSLGYKKSESLFWFEGNNISDNVFPIFWWPFKKDKSKINTIFQRMS
ncbi:MAG: hypothetical protein K1X91_00655 [Bacteriodetes bacterium]|nr:hypothetical protein [Bacteroidota bacterium]